MRCIALQTMLCESCVNPLILGKLFPQGLIPINQLYHHLAAACTGFPLGYVVSAVQQPEHR